jgi:hypothetical protein
MEHHDRGERLDTVGWSLFFIWVGIAWLAGVSIGIGLLGVAAITLAMQLVRKLQAMKVEVFGYRKHNPRISRESTRERPAGADRDSQKKESYLTNSGGLRVAVFICIK